MKHLTILLATILTLNTSTFAQNLEGQFDIGVGVSANFFASIVDGLAEQNTSRNQIPNLNGFIDYAISDNFSIGGAASFQTVDLVYEDYAWTTTNGDDMISDFTSNVTRFNVAIRPLIHLNFGDPNPRVDPYIGARLGYSVWNYQHNSPDPSFDLSVNASGPSFQFLGGVRPYFTNHIGMHLELAIGSPYYAAVGLNYKF